MARNTLENQYLKLDSSNLYKRPDQLYKSLKPNYSRHGVVDFLEKEDVYTLHFPVKKRFERNMYRVFNIDELWEIDLCDMRQFQKYNDGYSFILTIIDVFSKFAWVQALKNKSAGEVTKAFSYILRKQSRKPKIVQSDRGKEFTNKEFKNLLIQNNISQYFSYNFTLKCAVVERFNRTLKQLMYKYFTQNNTRRYIDVLPRLVKLYNNSYHSTIKMTPSDVTDDTTKDVNKIYSKKYEKLKEKTKNKRMRLKVNDIVRIAIPKVNFDRGYEQRWTQEKFYIKSVIKKIPFPLYTLTDYKNTSIAGRFYSKQLQKVQIRNGYPPIDKIIKTRGLGKSLQFFVSFKDGSPNQWIYKSTLEKQHGINDEK